MKFLIMVYSNPTSRALWDEVSEDEHMAFGRRHLAFRDSLISSGELIAAEALADQATARRVQLDQETVLVTDGPFAEVKEYVAGFFLVDCEDLERALALAALVPDAQFNHVEVRPVMDVKFLEEW